jgi:hypothetical protein
VARKKDHAIYFVLNSKCRQNKEHDSRKSLAQRIFAAKKCTHFKEQAIVARALMNGSIKVIMIVLNGSNPNESNNSSMVNLDVKLDMFKFFFKLKLSLK